MSAKKINKMMFGATLLLSTATLSLIAEDAANPGGGAKQTESASNEFTAEYKTSESVVDTVYDTAVMNVAAAKALGVSKLEGRQKSEFIKVRFPKVVMLKDEEVKTGTHVKTLRFLSETGKLKKEIPVQRFIPGKQDPAGIVVSKNRKYIAINNVKARDKQKGVIENSETEVLDTDGNVLWKVGHLLPGAMVSTNGEYILGADDECGGPCPVQVFNKTGLIAEINKNDIGYDVDFSNDGSFFAATTTTIDWEMNTSKHVDRYAGHLHVYDSTGKELWRKDNISKGESSFCEVKISSDDVINVMTGVNGYKLYQFDKEGNLLKEEQGTPESLRNFKK